MINSLNGRVFASSQMQDYMTKTFDISNGKNIIFAESFSKKCFFKKRLPKLSETDGEPHLIFAGVNKKYCGIALQIKEITNRKIHLHVCKNADIDTVTQSFNKNFFHTYELFNIPAMLDGSFATFLTQFDACLVTYDLKTQRAHDYATASQIDSHSPLLVGFLLCCPADI